ncbi:MAG: DNA-binding response regulator [Paenibacillus sp. RIFOXYA1_FULL_44_5]|nr:MAG: DNA-binding response regulator [Paenibacillus sp. RIFOXYA1_FULL_44_5]
MIQQRRMILVVDDEPLTRQGIQRTLEAWSIGQYQIIGAESGAEALEILSVQPIHLMITDIRMPEINGLALVEALQKNLHKPVVILISAHSEFDYAQTAIRLGVVNYLVKPFNKKKLIDAVEQALEIVDSRERVETMEKIVDTQLMHAKNEHVHASVPIQQAIQFIEEHLHESFSLRDAADHIHLNPSYLSSLFKEQTNLNFSEYVTRSRMQKAKELLLQTNLPITEIAEKVGYQTAKYFIKLFKEYEGSSPSFYRKKMNSHENESEF